MTLAAAEAYERHLFSCPECAAAAEETAEIRAALGALAPPAPQRRPLWTRSVLAAAAAIAAVAVGLFLALPQVRSPRPAATRGPSEGLHLEARSAEGALTLTWAAHPDADRYLVQLFAAEGTPLVSREVTALHLSVPLGDLHASGPLFARVEALSPLSDVVADSGLVALPRADVPPP